jgi:hypothetical protein
MRRLIINPVNPQILIAASTSGIHRSVNGGASWSLVSSFNAYDLEFKPGNPNTVYASGTNFYLSNNGGASFTYISSGINTSGANRLNIAVTPADTNYVYVLGSNSSNNGLFGVFRSVNSGVSFSLMASSPDILANSCASPSGGGQGWYDLSFAASPLNKNEVVAGGVNVWRSVNGGSSFSIIGCWVGTGNPPYVHSDHHELEYDATGILYSCNDGGIFKYTGTSWTDLTSPMNIAQMYKIGLSWKSPDMWITGHQDNGSNIYSAGNYMAKMAGDGMDCFIDRTNNSNVFASYYYAGFQRSTDGGSNWTSATSGLSGGSNWVSPWKQDPWIASRLYAGLANLYVSNNLGANWSSLSAPGGSGYIVEFAVAPSNNQVIYIIKGNTVRKTVNGGISWTNISAGLPTSSAEATFITINPSNHNMVWVTFSGYSAGNKVFQTTNGGTSWTNISSNLPNLPANCSAYQYGSNDRVYVGMDVGVYYRDNGSSTWTLYNTGLPNVPVSDMEISPIAPTKLRAATYGRGVYEVDVVAPSSAPVSDFTQTGKICSGTPMLFTDQSFQSPTAWTWSVAPSSGVSILSQGSPTPSISFPASGSYTISLVASNAFGAGSTAVRVLTVSPGPQLSFLNDSITACKDEMISLQVTGAMSYTWMPGNIEDSLLNFTATYPQPGYTVTGIVANGCTNSKAVVLNVSECLGLENAPGTENKIFVYPNPVSDFAGLISWRRITESYTAEVFDASGKQVIVQEGNFKKGNNHIRLDVSNLRPGVYLIRVKPENGEAQTSKIIKE